MQECQDFSENWDCEELSGIGQLSGVACCISDVSKCVLSFRLGGAWCFMRFTMTLWGSREFVLGH